jgi:hypothetical protein
MQASQSLLIRGTGWTMLAYMLIINGIQNLKGSQSLLFGLCSPTTTNGIRKNDTVTSQSLVIGL